MKNILFCLGLISLMNCKAQKDANNSTEKTENSKIGQENSTKNTTKIIYFTEGENKFLQEYQMNVTFKNMAEDSRCPQGVQCVWAGVAVANVELMSTTSRPVTLQFSTSDIKGKEYSKTQYFNGYKISLEEVSPQPTADKSVKSLTGSYRIGISISKESEQNNPTTK